MRALWAIWRFWLAPAALVVAAGLTFARAFAPIDLAVAILVAVVLGGASGALAGTRTRLLGGLWASVLPGAALLVGLALAVAVIGGAAPTPSLVQRSVTTFLLVGLPAPGLGSLAVVVVLVLYPAMALCTWASFHRRTLTTVAAPVAALAVAGLLVAPVGSSWWVPVVLAAAIGVVLISDVRNDLVSLPPLVGTGTELRRQLSWWRPLAEIAPVLAALLAVAALVPTAGTYDLRALVHPDTVNIPDPSPLAVAARWRQQNKPVPVARLDVNGPSPGRVRLAVLDNYSDVGWSQAATYQVTGDRLAADPVFPARLPAAHRAHVTVTPQSDVDFRAAPSAGTPVSVANPDGLLYAPAAGAVLTDHPRPVTYATDSTATAPPSAEQQLAGRYPAGLTRCPNSDLQLVAQQLVGTTPSVIGRLDAIESWLLARRIYDPSGPGGQTIGSVEQFLRQPYARGNLEAFVTTFALLGRCAGVPNRVVIGYPAPSPGRSELTRDKVTAWVEIPLATAGWVPFDPLPTPQEQQLQAERADRPSTPQPPPPKRATTPPRQVHALEPTGPGFPWGWVIAGGSVVALLAGWTLLSPVLVGRRRRRIADPTAAVIAAWASTTDALALANTDIGPSHTPSEVVRLGAGSLPITVPGLVAALAPIVDRARYSGEPASEEEAGLAWAYVDVIEKRLGNSAVRRIEPLVHPRRVWTRLAGTFRVARRWRRWRADLPDSMLISSADAPDDIPDVSLEARIGDGSTGTVYRGVLVSAAQPVAVKVFRYGPNDPGFDENRFDWEVRIAREVSGLPHLPEVHAAGITPISGRPYLVSSLYDEGTLLDRVRRGGPMTTAEAVAIGADVAVALETMHQLGVIHSDVKPENVFADPEGWVLGDLGAAWLRAARGPAASLTPPYAAPEVWRGSAPTPQADIYSLALTMLYAATGEVPIAGNPPPPDNIVATFPDLPIMLQALDPDPRRRPRTVSELGRALRPGFFAGVTSRGVVTISLAAAASESTEA